MNPLSVKRFKRVILHQPPKVILAKVHRRLWLRWRYLKAELRGTTLSDEQIYKLLNFDGTLREYISCAGKQNGVRFFVDAQKKEQTIESLRQMYPYAEATVIKAADKICHHIFDLLSSGEIHLGKEIDWHCDFKTGRKWPLRHYSRIDVIQPKDNSDIKVPWELNRCHHFVTLGKAYWYTSDERYAKEWFAQVDSWIYSNPTELGVNWTCTMEVAIRLINWIWTYYFFYDSPSFTYVMRIKLLKSLLEHCRFIFSNLENLGIRNNHYLANLVGLIYAGTLFPEFKEAKIWRDFTLAELIKEIKHQFYPDGANFEASIGYHRFSLELILSAILLLRLNNIEIPADTTDHLEKMFEFVVEYTKPDGTSPQIGDSDDGRIHILSEYTKKHSNDHRYLLSIGAVLFERTDLCRAATCFWEEAFWLLGSDGLERFRVLNKSAPFPKSYSFKDSGIYIMRKDDLYMIIDAGGNGQDGAGGHAHNDTMSFELYAYDKTFIVDPGTYTYTASLELRNEFRSTKSHNTIVVDEEEMCEIEPTLLFSLRSNVSPKVLKWETSDKHDIFEVENTGYCRLSQPVKHKRYVYFNKQKCYWRIEDLLIGDGKHRFDLYFHFAPMRVKVDEENPLAVLTLCKGANLYLSVQKQEGLSLEIMNGWVSYKYGCKEKAPVVRYSKISFAPTSFLTVIYPLCSDMENLELKEENLILFQE